MLYSYTNAYGMEEEEGKLHNGHYSFQQGNSTTASKIMVFC